VSGKLTGQFADKPTRGQSSRGLVNSRTSQLAERGLKKKIFNHMKTKLYFTLNLTLTITLSATESVQ